MNKLSHTTNAAIGEQPTKHTNDTHRTCDSLLRQTSVNDPTKNCKPQHRQQQSTHTNREPPQNESDQKMHGETPTLLLFTEGKTRLLLLDSAHLPTSLILPRHQRRIRNDKHKGKQERSQITPFPFRSNRSSSQHRSSPPPILLLSTIDTLIVAPFLHSDPTNGSSSEVIR